MLVIGIDPGTAITGYGLVLAIVDDVIANCPTQAVDIAFVLKTIPCLEQVDKTAGIELLNQLQARNIVVSFPVHSLAGG